MFICERDYNGVEYTDLPGQVFGNITNDPGDTEGLIFDTR